MVTAGGIAVPAQCRMLLAGSVHQGRAVREIIFESATVGVQRDLELPGRGGGRDIGRR